VPDFQAHVRGRIAWISAVNPGRGEKLRRMFELVDWDAENGRDGS
jgi:RNA-directed DNA polymerase